MMSPLIRLPSGMVIDLASVRMIARKEINQYVVFLENVPSQAIITGEDIDFLVKENLISTAKPSSPLAQDAG